MLDLAHPFISVRQAGAEFFQFLTIILTKINLVRKTCL